MIFSDPDQTFQLILPLYPPLVSVLVAYGITKRLKLFRGNLAKRNYQF